MTLPEFETPEVRHLAWACFSPPLLLSPALARGENAPGNCPLALTPERQAWLVALESLQLPG